MKNRLFAIPKALFIGAIFAVATVSASAQSQISMETYKTPDGADYFLVPLQAASDNDVPPVDVAVLVEVSAAQKSADIRAEGVNAVRALAAGLPAGSRIQIFTSDNETESLTGGFVPADSDEVTTALETLSSNTPLGAMDMTKALRTAE